MRKLVLVVALFALCACSQSQTPSPKTEDQKALYTMGVVLHQNTYQLDLTPEDYKYVEMGMTDAAAGKKPALDLDAGFQKLKQVLNDRREKRKAAGKEFLEKVAAEKGAKKTASGLVYKEIAAGAGAQPKTGDAVTVQYTGTFISGKEFDSTVKRGKPAVFKMGDVIPCFSEGIGMMKVGGKARLYCPSDMAYGDLGNPPGVPGGALLIFEVELLETKTASAPQAEAKK